MADNHANVHRRDRTKYFSESGGFTAGLGPSGFSQRTPWNFEWYPRGGQVNTSVRPPAKWKIAVCSAALIGELGFFLAIELPEMGRSGEHNPGGILGGFAALGLCIGLLIL